MADKTTNILEWKITASDDSAPGLASFRQRVERTMKDTERASASNGGFLERMAARARENRADQRRTGENALQNVLTSPSGAVGFAADSLGIGIQVMAADALGRALDASTRKAIELRDALREGKITTEEMARGFATSLPVLGSFVGFFLNVRELITGEQAEIDKANAAVKRQEESFRRKQSLLIENRNLLAEHAAIMLRMANDSTATWMGGTAGQRFSAKAQRDEAIRQAEQQKQTEINDLAAKARVDPELARLNAVKDAATRELSRLETEKQRIIAEYNRTPEFMRSRMDTANRVGALNADIAKATGEQVAADTAVQGYMAENYGKRLNSINARRDPELEAMRKAAAVADEADARAHEQAMLQITADGIKARWDAEKAGLSNRNTNEVAARYAQQQKQLQDAIAAAQVDTSDTGKQQLADLLKEQEQLTTAYGADALKAAAADRSAVLRGQYETEYALLQQSINAQQQEYDRIAASADERTKAEMAARIELAKAQQRTLVQEFNASTAELERETREKQRQLQYRETDRGYEREDMARRFTDAARDFSEKYQVRPQFTFEAPAMDAGQTGIAELFRDSENVARESLSAQREVREYTRQLAELTREQNRMMERQQRLGAL